MKRVFEQFFSTKSKGVGLELSLTQKIIKANRGDISVVSEEVDRFSSKLVKTYINETNKTLFPCQFTI